MAVRGGRTTEPEERLEPWAEQVTPAVEALPGIARLAASAAWHTTGWGLRSSARAGRRVARAVTDPDEAASLARDATGAAAALGDLACSVLGAPCCRGRCSARCVRIEARGDQHTDRDKPSPPDSLPTVNRDIAAHGQFSDHFGHQFAERRPRGWHIAIRDRERQIPDAAFFAYDGFVLEVEFPYLVGHQQGDDYFNPGVVRSTNLVV